MSKISGRMMPERYRYSKTQIFQFLVSQRVEGVGSIRDFSLPRAWYSITFFLRGQSHKPDHGLFSAGDNDLLTPASPLDKAGKLGLRFVGGDGCHVASVS